MTIGFILNGEDVILRTDAERRLIDILREHFRLLGAKAGCLSGNCGVCSVILNGEVVKACLVPVFKIQGGEIVTIEGFSLNDEYQDIVRGFSEAGLESCGFCTTGKILTVETLLAKISRPTKREILAAFNGIRCRCTEPESLVEAVLAVSEIRQRRLYGRGA
jgi:carbon-monoxide dehydrogenase small subunit